MDLGTFLEETQNLSTIWPLEPTEMLVPRVAKAAQQSYELSVNSSEGVPATEVTFSADFKDRGGDLGTFPIKYQVALTLIVKKSAYYSALFEELSQIQPKTLSNREVARQSDLSDHWAREILYLDHVLEMAMQWAYSDQRAEPCLALFYFEAQEGMSTDHSLENTRDKAILPMQKPRHASERINSTHVAPLTLHT